MAKKIVICCDGTGQKLDVQRTNVVRLFRVLSRADSDAQIAYYDPGVGTIPATGALTWVSRRLTLTSGLLAGYGLLDNVSRAYGFVVDNYEEGDQIYLFGFSRGAFTVRVLAGLLHRIGVLRPETRNLIPYALELYKPHYTRMKDAKKREEARSVTDEFHQFFCRRGEVNIRFLGLWDTVKAFGIFNPRSLPHIRHNPDIGTVRHALAIHEHRRSFLPTSWGGLDDYVERPPPPRQDVKEVWFAGTHSDIGGGYRKEESGLSLFSLKWMINEARKCELRFSEQELQNMLDREFGSPQALDADEGFDLKKGFWKLHPSRTTLWRLFDQVPRPELSNAPPRSAKKCSHLEPELPVPVGWPKLSMCLWPTAGHRDLQEFKRGNKVLVHKSVRKLVRNGKYQLKVDNRIVHYENEESHNQPS